MNGVIATFKDLKGYCTSDSIKRFVIGTISLGALSPLIILIEILARMFYPSILTIGKASYIPIIVAMIFSIQTFLKIGIRILQKVKSLSPLETARLTFFSVILAFSISSTFTFGSTYFPLEEALFFYIQVFARNFVIWWIFLVHLVRVPVKSWFRIFTEGVLAMVFAVDWYLELWTIHFTNNITLNVSIINLVSLTSWSIWLFTVKREATFTTEEEKLILFCLPFAGAVLISINDILFQILNTGLPK